MKTLALILFVMAFVSNTNAQDTHETDTFKTPEGELAIIFLGHGTLMFNYSGLIVHVDPWSNVADYSGLPKADVILITHEHGDHLDAGTVQKIRKDTTEIIITESCKGAVEGTVMKNGDKATVKGLSIEAVPAYNIKHKRDNGEHFHPKGRGNGYIVDFGGTRVYIAGDSENTPEMKAQKDIDIAFLPMNLPYTMTPEMVADAARAFRPKVLYPYHFGKTDTSELVRLLKNEDGIEVRIRNLQ